ncbi:zinc ribbon domain-containing protein [Clostridium sp. FP2]|uniref:zinc ribbon domain-containing protein n=1 Tax=Clostridium sp. FP2 TaxID=2724481 RepID=UPI0013E99423|nr:zinc ribbon domain-containing protein [Clostridium sp. FP2]MBZ9622819.1 zinc ribbon domain-containing protein [Clostridium sp. FP2]
MSLFKGLIKCKKCGKNFNFKNDHSQYIYLCSGYKNYGSNYCQRNIIYESDLINIISLHQELSYKRRLLNEDDIKEDISKIEVDMDNIIISYKDGTQSEWNKSILSV